LAAPLSRAQFGSFGDAPVEINAEGGTKFEGGVAVAENNVVIQYGAATIYCDYAQYNPETRDVLVRGNVRIYRDKFVFIGDRAVYNLETKQLHAADFKGDSYPFFFSADTVATLGANAFQTGDATFTTSDSSKPDYHLKAKTVRIYQKDHIVFSNVCLYIGKTPVFWWPYLYQPLDNDVGYRFSPGYRSTWGAFILTQYIFPIGDKMSGTLHFDPYSKRGVGFGLDSKFEFGKDNRDWGNFRSYYIDDSNPNINNTGVPRVPVDNNRYRVSFQNRFYITDDIYTNINITKLSDQYIVQDFMPGEYQVDPQPDNYISVTKWDENYTLTGVARAQLNNFFETTERLPEFSLDIKRMPIFDSPIFYEGETSAGKLARNYPTDSSLVSGTSLINYSSTRLDTFHQILYPHVYGGWFSFTPSAGVRGTYYSQSLDNAGNATGDTFRAAVNAGFEASFKISREFEKVESRTWGLDGLRHVMQPYTDLSYSYSNRNPADIYQFDRYNNSTQLPSFDFPEFRSTDAIGSWAVWQFGVRNRLQTRRDGDTLNWLEVDTYFDLYLQEPYFTGVTYQNTRFSPLYNKLRWNPLPWLSVQFDTALPVFEGGFTEINTDIGFMVTSNLRLDIGQRYINNNPYFQNSNLIVGGAYLRLNDNWGLRVSEQYEAVGNLLEFQRYEICRDLSSWIASIGLLVGSNNGGASQYGVLLTLTLKDMPQTALPYSFNPELGSGRTK
jgi:hypothetical protein